MSERVIQCVAQGKRKGVVKFEGNKPKRLHQHQSHESDSKPMQEEEEEERQLGGETKEKCRRHQRATLERSDVSAFYKAMSKHLMQVNRQNLRRQHSEGIKEQVDLEALLSPRVLLATVYSICI